MRVNLGTISVSDAHRIALRRRQGRSGMATRDDVRAHVLAHGCAMFTRVPKVEAPPFHARDLERCPYEPNCTSPERVGEEQAGSKVYARFACGHRERIK